MAKIDITARLNAASVDGILASANQIYDENMDKFQTAVNEDLDKRLKEQDGRLERYHDDLVDEVNREVAETIETSQETIEQLKEASEWLKNDPSGAQAIMEQTNQNTANIAMIGRNTGLDEYSQFSTGMDYSIGDVVLYDGVLFRFKADHAKGEWDYNEVEEWSEKKEREEFATMVNTLGIEAFSEGYISSVGGFSEIDNSYLCTDYINVSSIYRLHTENLDYANAYTSAIAFYDINKICIAKLSNVGAVTTYDVDVPNGAFFMRATYDITDSNPRIVLLYSKPIAEKLSETIYRTGNISSVEENVFYFSKIQNYIQKQEIARAYEDGILDMYIDTSNIEVEAIGLWNYRSIMGIDALYVSIPIEGNDNYYLLHNLPFDKIDNFKPIPLTFEGRNVGYVVLKDKQKFIDNPIGSGVAMNISKVCGGKNHPYLWMYPMFTEHINKIQEKHQALHISDALFTIDNSYVAVDGNIVSSEEFCCTDYIRLTAVNKIYTENLEYANKYLSVIAFYDNKQKFISNVSNVGDYSLSYYVADIPENACYIRATSTKRIANPILSFLYNEIELQNFLTRRVDISLPDTIYAVVGDTLQLFYRGMIKAVNPYNYDILVTCSKGSQYPRYYELTPKSEDVGNIPFKVTIKDNNRSIIAEKECTIKIVNVQSSPSSTVKIACFGDSLTAGGTWVAEAHRRLTGTGGTPEGNGLRNVSFVGAKEINGAGYYGVGGWTWESYTTEGYPAVRFNVVNVTSLQIGATYTNNGFLFTIREINVTEGSGNILCAVDRKDNLPQNSGILSKSSGNGDSTVTFTSYTVDSQNPLWDYEKNKMSFIPYANSYADGKIDIVYTLLSWNGQTPGRVDFSSVSENVKKFADTLHSEFPNAKLKLMGIQVPSVNGGMGANYGATGTSYADGYGMVVTALNMNKAYQDFAKSEGYINFVEFVNVSSQFDSENNMPQTSTKVNTRNSITEKRGTNGVHPSTEGYLQIADVVYRNLMAEL